MKATIVEGNLLDNISKKKLKKVMKEMNHKPDVKIRIILNSMSLIFPHMAGDKKLGMTLGEMLEIRRMAEYGERVT